MRGGVRFVCLWTCVELATSGCIYSYGGPKKTTTQHDRFGPLEVRGDALPGKGELLADGRFRYTVQLDQLCQHRHFVDERDSFTSHKRLNAVGYADVALWGLASALTLSLGVFFFSAASQSDAELTASGSKNPGGDRAASVVVGSFSILLGALADYAIYRDFHDRKSDAKLGWVWRGKNADKMPATMELKELEKTASRDDGLQFAACDEKMGQLGALHLSTPWGSRVTATPISGVATFDLEWDAESLREVTRSTVDAPLRSAWSVRSEALGLATAWTPSNDDVALQLALIKKSEGQLIAGASPAAIAATGLELDGNQLVIGETATIKLTVENRGASTGVRVSAKLRSGLAALDGVTFVFGEVQPSRKATKSIDIRIPADTSDDSATVIVSFSEASGHVPADITQKVRLVRRVCPEGKLTREAYAKKRARLKQTLEEGSLTQADFDKYDAELVRCLE